MKNTKEQGENDYFIPKILLQFLIASFLGWLYEIGAVYCLFRTYYDRGVLHLPLCPIYGFGMLVLLIVFHRVKNPAVIFFGSVAVTTAIELASTYLLEWKFGYPLWTYEGWPLNYENRISVISSCIFGLMALLFFKIIRPVTQKLFSSKAKPPYLYWCLFWQQVVSYGRFGGCCKRNLFNLQKSNNNDK